MLNLLTPKLELFLKQTRSALPLTFYPISLNIFCPQLYLVSLKLLYFLTWNRNSLHLPRKIHFPIINSPTLIIVSKVLWATVLLFWEKLYSCKQGTEWHGDLGIEYLNRQDCCGLWKEGYLRVCQIIREKNAIT